MKPLIKVCGMKDLDNVKSIAALKPDFLGFIFYENSKRKVFLNEVDSLLEAIDQSIKKVGVFVNANKNEILKIQNKFDYIQLHGDESPEFCKTINKVGTKIIKAFGIDNAFDFDKLKEFIPYCSYFLFDTKTADYGGSGKKYNWQKLEEYQFEVPFFLSGGICLEDAERIKTINHPQLYVVDINSKFEIEPGLKNMELAKTFINKIRL